MLPLAAYRKAYPDQTASTDRTATSHAYEMERDARIVAQIRQSTPALQQQTNLVPRIEVSRDMVTQGIASIATNPNTKDNVRLRAYELLGKVAGIDLFREIHVTEKVHRTVEDIDRELKERLSSLAPMIEGKTVDPAPESSPKPPDRRRKPKA